MLIALCSLKGSPGVTTFATALAACRWPTGMRPVVVEVDPSGGDLAARLELQLSPGLVSLAAAAHAQPGPAGPDALWAHVQRLPGGLAVLPAPPGAGQAQAALTALLSDSAALVRRTAADPDTVVLADCGRVDAGALTQPLIRAADEVLLLTRAHVDDLVHLTTRLDSIAEESRHVSLLLVGPGCSPVEVSRELGMPVMAVVPRDRRTAAALCGHARVSRGVVRSALGQAAADVATTVLSSRRKLQEPESDGRPDGIWRIGLGYGQDSLAAARSVAQHDGGSS